MTGQRKPVEIADVRWPHSLRDLIGGLLLPAPFIGYGAWCMYYGDAYIIGANWNDPGPGILHLSGAAAVAVGAACISLGCLIFARLFLRNWLGLWRTAHLLEPLALLGVTVAIMYAAFAWASTARW